MNEWLNPAARQTVSSGAKKKLIDDLRASVLTPSQFFLTVRRISYWDVDFYQLER